MQKKKLQPKLCFRKIPVMCPIITQDGKIFDIILPSKLGKWQAQTHKILKIYDNVIQVGNCILSNYSKDEILIYDNYKIKIFNIKKQEIVFLKQFPKIYLDLLKYNLNNETFVGYDINVKILYKFQNNFKQIRSLPIKDSIFQSEKKNRIVESLYFFESGRIIVNLQNMNICFLINSQFTSFQKMELQQYAYGFYQLSDKFTFVIGFRNKVVLTKCQVESKQIAHKYMAFYSDFIYMQKFLVCLSYKNAEVIQIQGSFYECKQLISKSKESKYNKILKSKDYLVFISQEQNQIVTMNHDLSKILSHTKYCIKNILRLLSLNQNKICILSQCSIDYKTSIQLFNKIQIVQFPQQNVIKQKNVKAKNFIVESQNFVTDGINLVFICKTFENSNNKYLFIWDIKMDKMVNKPIKNNAKLYPFKKVVTYDPFIVSDYNLQNKITLDYQYKFQLLSQNQILVYNKEELNIHKLTQQLPQIANLDCQLPIKQINQIFLPQINQFKQYFKKADDFSNQKFKEMGLQKYWFVFLEGGTVQLWDQNYSSDRTKKYDKIPRVSQMGLLIYQGKCQFWFLDLVIKCVDAVIMGKHLIACQGDNLEIYKLQNL